jgi:hypothetical protein
MSSMQLARFTEVLDTYGADPQRWPAADRDAALALLADSQVARAQQQEAALLDAALDAYAVAAPAAALRQTIIASAAPARRTWRQSLADLWRELGGWHLAAPAFAASLTLGALLPMWLDETATDLPDEDLIAAIQLVDELSEWTP